MLAHESKHFGRPLSRATDQNEVMRTASSPQPCKGFDEHREVLAGVHGADMEDVFIVHTESLSEWRPLRLVEWSKHIPVHCIWRHGDPFGRHAIVVADLTTRQLGYGQHVIRMTCRQSSEPLQTFPFHQSVNLRQMEKCKIMNRDDFASPPNR